MFDAIVPVPIDLLTSVELPRLRVQGKNHDTLTTFAFW